MWTYAPDLDERTPNILLTGSTNLVPNNRGGFTPALLPSTTSYGDMAAFAVGVGAGFVVRDNGTTTRLFVGTSGAAAAGRIYELNQATGNSYTDVSRGAGYSDALQWMFDIYGGHALASISVGATMTEIQGSNGVGGTAFSNLTNAPKGKIIVVQDNALYVFDYDSGGGEVYDGWIRSDTGSITSWTPGTGECVSGRFTETPGSITAAIKQGNGVVVFKESGLWRGQYVGLPEVVRWELVTPTVGCLGPKAVVNVDDVLYFADARGFWRYDGSRPQRISDGLNDEWRSSIGDQTSAYNRSLVQIGVDDIRNVLSIYMQQVSGSSAQRHYNYNYVTGAWGPPSTHQRVSTEPDVYAVVNGPYLKMSAVTGLSTLASGGVNALRFGAFTSGASSTGLVIMNSTSGSVSATVSDRTVTIKPSILGSDFAGKTLTRLYPLYRSYSLSGAGASTATSYTVTAYRRPFLMGNAQSAPPAKSYDTTLDYVDVTANGNWFQLAIAHRAQSTSGNGIGISFEWLGVDPEFSDGSRPRN